MKKVHVRPAVSNDIPELIELDHGYSTDHVWQMGHRDENSTVSVEFQQVRLPRPMRVRYPREPGRLKEEWTAKSVVLVSELEEERTGYLVLSAGPAPGALWITDLVVDLRFRRQGHGSGLLQAAGAWSAERGFHRLFLEMQSKNFPAIRLAKKLGYVFAGYSDRYYPDGDIALFFVLSI